MGETMDFNFRAHLGRRRVRGAPRAPRLGYSRRMHGLHLTADLYRCRCDAAWLTDARTLQPWCLQALASAGLAAANQVFATLPPPGGIAAAVLLPDAHVVVHTWPERRAVTLDVYVGNAGDGPAKARTLMTALVDRFQPEWTEQRSLDRGDGE
jgi:S-adenosylmethionine decarboxylase